MPRAPTKLTESDLWKQDPKICFSNSFWKFLGIKRKTRILTQHMMCNTFGDCLLEGIRQTIKTGGLEEMLVLEN